MTEPGQTMAEVSARGGTRTRTGLLPRDFKSLASTDFATRAGGKRNIPDQWGIVSRRTPREARLLQVVGARPYCF
jgi:hypothetical protein